MQDKHDNPDAQDTSAQEDDAATGISQDMLILGNNLDPAEANVLNSLLASEGVHSQVDDANTANVFGHLGYVVNGVRIRVPESELGRARNILEEFSEGRLALSNTDEEAPPSLEAQRLTAWTGDEQIVKRWLAKPPRWPGLMLPALILGPVWFFYRKLYKLGFLFMALEVGWFVAGNLLLPVGNGTQTVHVLFTCGWLFLRIGMTSMGDTALYNAAQAGITKTRGTHVDEAHLQSALRKRGGINVPAAIFAIAAYTALRLLT